MSGRRCSAARRISKQRSTPLHPTYAVSGAVVITAFGAKTVVARASLDDSFGSNRAVRSRLRKRPFSADSVEEVGFGVIAVAGSAVTLATVTGASPQIAEVGAGISIASLRRFWAVAARWNSSRAPF